MQTSLSTAAKAAAAYNALTDLRSEYGTPASVQQTITAMQDLPAASLANLYDLLSIHATAAEAAVALKQQAA